MLGAQTSVSATVRMGDARVGSRYVPITAHLDQVAIRLLDVTIASILLVVLLPLFVLVAIAIYLADPGKIIFAHQRIGQDGRAFPCYKFRSMVVDSEQRLADWLEQHPDARAEWARDHKLRDDPRITGLGRFLRKSSIDELPQLFNVLRGEMGIVGPRPIVAAEIARYRRFYANYASVKPGITGLWQVSGRNNTSYRRRVALDVRYSKSKSVFLDLRIMAATVPAVLMARGSH
jgi:lipopolysaccharide/colanic/teichoic acid biosynthesis glycosyltransferase